MKTVYDLDGNAHIKHPIDARECVENLGWSYESKINEQELIKNEKPVQTKKPGRPKRG